MRSFPPLPWMRKTSGSGDCAPGQAERFGDAQAAAVEQGQDSGIAGGDPCLFRLQFDRVDHGARRVFGQGAGQFFAEFGGAGRQNGGCVKAVAFGQPPDEALDRRQFPRERSGADAIGAFRCHPGAHVADGDSAERAEALAAAMMKGDEAEEPAYIRAIGPQGRGGGPVETFFRGQPILQGIPACGGDQAVGDGCHDNQCRIDRSKTPAKKLSRSVPCWGVN